MKAMLDAIKKRKAKMLPAEVEVDVEVGPSLGAEEKPQGGMEKLEAFVESLSDEERAQLVTLLVPSEEKPEGGLEDESQGEMDDSGVKESKDGSSPKTEGERQEIAARAEKMLGRKPFAKGGSTSQAPGEMNMDLADDMYDERYDNESNLDRKPRGLGDRVQLNIAKKKREKA